MRFVLYTDKSVPQSTAALNERLRQPRTRSSPALEGWVEKGGRFSLALTTPVIAQFTRTTRLHGQIKRENGQTVIRGNVPDGAGPQGQIAVLIGIALVALFVLAQQQAVLAILALLAGGVLVIPMRGDYDNSDRLLLEIERTLKASPKPPKTLAKTPARAATVAAAAKSRTTANLKPKSPISKPKAASAKSTSTNAASPRSAASRPTTSAARTSAASAVRR